MPILHSLQRLLVQKVIFKIPYMSGNMYLVLLLHIFTNDANSGKYLGLSALALDEYTTLMI